MKTYYYIETYFRGDETPYLIGDGCALFVAKTVESAFDKIVTLPTNATYKPVEAFEHLAYNRERYPHLPQSLDKAGFYRQIEREVTQGITQFI